MPVLTLTALSYLGIWPVLFGLLWIFYGIGPSTHPYEITTVGSLLWLAAAFPHRSISVGPIFSRWQIVCIAILVSSYLIGLTYPSRDPMAAAFRSAVDLFLLIGAVSFVFLLRILGERLVGLVLLTMVISMTAYVFFLVIFFPKMVDGAAGVWNHAFLPFVNVRRFTNLLAPVSVVALGLWASKIYIGRKLNHYLFGAWVVFCTVIFWTGGRGPVLGITVSILTVGLIVGGAFGSRLFKGGLAGAAIGLVLSAVLPRSDGYWFFKRVLTTAEAPSLDASTSGRLTIWSQTLDLISQRVWFGHGPGQWVYQRPDFVWHSSTHNFPLQVLHDFGAIGGTAALLLVFGTLFSHLSILRERNHLHRVAVLMLVTMVAQSFFDAIFFAALSLQLALFAFGLMHASMYKMQG